jgi:hypothetical protein
VVLFVLFSGVIHYKFLGELFKVIFCLAFNLIGIVEIVAFDLVEFLVELMEGSPIDIS